MKKLISIILTLCMVASAAAIISIPTAATPWDGETVGTGFAGGTGKIDDPYTIATAEQLAWFAKSVNEGDWYGEDYVKLTADIDLGDKEWTPIGTVSLVRYEGMFDGDGHTVSGLHISDQKRDFNGLFGDIGNCVIKNLKVTGSYIFAKNAGGAIAGKAEDGAMIINCASDVELIEGRFVGGIVGNIRFANSYTGSKDIDGSIYVIGCHSKGNVLGNNPSTTDTYAGGIVGMASSGAIIYCTNEGNVSTKTGSSISTAAGIVGLQGANSLGGPIWCCSNSGTIVNYDTCASAYYASGIVGRAGHVRINSSIYGCVNTGEATVYKTGTTEVIDGKSGGISGHYNTTIPVRYCITSKGEIFGLIKPDNPDIENCMKDAQPSAMTSFITPDELLRQFIADRFAADYNEAEKLAKLQAYMTFASKNYISGDLPEKLAYDLTIKKLGNKPGKDLRVWVNGEFVTASDEEAYNAGMYIAEGIFAYIAATEWLDLIIEKYDGSSSDFKIFEDEETTPDDTTTEAPADTTTEKPNDTSAPNDDTTPTDSAPVVTPSETTDNKTPDDTTTAKAPDTEAPAKTGCGNFSVAILAIVAMIGTGITAIAVKRH